MNMKIIVMGGTGLIGSKVVKNLQALGHEAVAASPSSGVDAVTGQGLEAAFKGADVVVDVTNSPSFADAEVLAFFEKSARNMLAAEIAAGVKHHVALSIVGAERSPDSGYLRAKVAQETAISAGKIPFTILRATQFFEFVGRIVDGSVVDGVVKLSPAKLQPVAADDVAAAVTKVAIAAPVNGVVEITGPESIGLDELGRRQLAAKKDTRKIITDPSAKYFGTVLNDQSLTSEKPAHVGARRFDEWLAS